MYDDNPCLGCEHYEECEDRDNTCCGCKYDGECELQTGCWMCKLGEYLQCNNGFEIGSDYDDYDEDEDDEDYYCDDYYVDDEDDDEDCF